MAVMWRLMAAVCCRSLLHQLADGRAAAHEPDTDPPDQDRDRRESGPENFVHYPILHLNDSEGQHAKAKLREHEGAPVWTDQVTEVRVKNSEGDGGSEPGPEPLPERSPRPDPPEEGTDRRKLDPVLAPLDTIDQKVTDTINRKLNGKGSQKPPLRYNRSWAPGLQTADELGQKHARGQPHEVVDRREQDLWLLASTGAIDRKR